MRKIYFLVACLCMSQLIFCQEKSKVYYESKSQRQKTTGWILAGTGALAIITGLIVQTPENPSDESAAYASGGFIVGGVVAGLASIPFFIGASKNKKGAVHMAFNRPGNLLDPRQTNRWALSLIYKASIGKR